jgi:predicted O-methyltransferase YrrM
VLDERVRAVLARMEADVAEPGLADTGRFLFTLVAPQTDCEVLEVGAGRGYSTVWLGAGVRYLGGRVLSLVQESESAVEWRRNVADAGLEEWAELLEGDALETLGAIDDVFDVVLLDGAEAEYERSFDLARTKVEPAGLIVAHNVAPGRNRREDPSLLSVTVPIGSGVEMSVVHSESL